MGDFLGYSFLNQNLLTRIQLMLSQQQARESQHQVAAPPKDAHYFLSLLDQLADLLVQLSKMKELV